MSIPSGQRILPHDAFFGALQVGRKLPGFTLAHRIADRPPDEIEIHTHTEAHFVLVTGGKYVSSARGSSNRTVLIYNPPGTTHRDHFNKGVGSFFTLSICGERLADAAEMRLREFASFLVEPSGLCLAHALLRECARGDQRSDLAAESLCYELMAAAGIPAGEEKLLRPGWVDGAYELLQDNYEQNMTVSEVARSVGVHPIHLARTFRIFFRSTPGDLLRRRRLEKAMELLMLSDRSLADIALHCGFTDQSHLTNAFRQVYGVPPARFRRNTLNANHS
jgi:AraC family transcriptional regulator